MLAEKLSAKDRADPAVQSIIAEGSASNINLLRMVMKALPNDGVSKDIDFSSATISTRWAAGAHDAKRTLAQKNWLAPLPPNAGLVVHELPQV